MILPSQSTTSVLWLSQSHTTKPMAACSSAITELWTRACPKDHPLPSATFITLTKFKPRSRPSRSKSELPTFLQPPCFRYQSLTPPPPPLPTTLTLTRPSRPRHTADPLAVPADPSKFSEPTTPSSMEESSVENGSGAGTGVWAGAEELRWESLEIGR